MSVELKSGVTMISNERARKIASGVRSYQKDDKLTSGELLDAADCYIRAAECASSGDLDKEDSEFLYVVWPFASDPAYCFSDPLPNLVRAGALIAAEIDRLLRAGGEKKLPANIAEVPVSPPSSDEINTEFLKSVGFTEQRPGFYGHECGVYYLEKDKSWSYNGLVMRDPKSRQDVSRFVDKYNSMTELEKRMANALGSIVRQAGI